MKIYKTLLFFLIHVAALAQQNALTEKYNAYRIRLVNEFMLGVGDGFGMSIPASMRNTNDSNYKGAETIKWGDATIELSYYIAVLATEYKLVETKEQKQQTLKELFYALEAFNRLDYYAEEYFNAKPSLNGFFVRSDVGRGLYENKNRNTRYAEEIDKLNGVNNKPVNNISSEWLNCYLKNDTKRFAMSKDQTFHVFLAMAFVVKCVPQQISFQEKNFMDGETSIHKEAQKITDRVMSYIHPIASRNTLGKWQLNTPNGKKVGAGYNAWTFAHGMSLAQKKISGTENPKRHGLSWWFAKAVYNTTWGLFRPIYFFNQNEGSKTLTLVCVNNSCRGNADKVYRYSFLFEKYPNYHVPLIYGFMHGKISKKINFKDYEKILQQAPFDGPQNEGDMKDRNYNWSATSLIMHPENRGERPNFPGKYNGLDYMFLYNLFLLCTSKGY